MTDRKPDIVCISSQAWCDLWTRKQRFMDRFAQVGHRVLYVEPIEPFLWRLKGQACNLSLGLAAQVSEVKPHLSVLSLPVMLPYSRRFSRINALNQRWAAGIIRRASESLGMRDPIIWTYSPLVGDRAPALGGRFLVYDCVDDWSQYPGAGRFVRQLEDRLLQAADVVLVTSPSLLARAGKYARRVHLVPNGVDTEMFRRATLPETPIPDDVRGLPGPIVGFVGAIAAWIDLDAIAHIAAQRPAWTIVLVGPSARGVPVERLRGYANIVMLGYRPKESLPGYLKAFDVCISPFKPSDLATAADPLKVYEYLAAGKPTVVSGLPAMRELGDILYVADSPQAYLEQIEAALCEHDEAMVARRMAFVQGRSWERLFAQVRSIAVALCQEADSPGMGARQGRGG